MMFTKIFGRNTEFQKFMISYATNIEEAGSKFATFVRAFDPERLPEWIKDIKDIEHACDDVTHKTMNWLKVRS